MRAVLATLAVRDSVPDAERMSLLPFTVGDFAGFHIDDVLPGRALMLVDAPAGKTPAPAGPADSAISDAPWRSINARLLIAAVQGLSLIHISLFCGRSGRPLRRPLRPTPLFTHRSKAAAQDRWPKTAA